MFDGWVVNHRTKKQNHANGGGEAAQTKNQSRRKRGVEEMGGVSNWICTKKHPRASKLVDLGKGWVWGWWGGRGYGWGLVVMGGLVVGWGTAALWEPYHFRHWDNHRNVEMGNGTFIMRWKVLGLKCWGVGWGSWNELLRYNQLIMLMLFKTTLPRLQQRQQQS